jgi:toxin HigB-1
LAKDSAAPRREFRTPALKSIRDLWKASASSTTCHYRSALKHAEGLPHPRASIPDRGQLPDPLSKLLTGVTLQATLNSMQIRSFAHKGLKKFYEEDVAKGLPPETVDKLRKMLAFLDDMAAPKELYSLPTWRARVLSGDRKGYWSMSVTRNLRLTFRIDETDDEICDLNLEDYH